MKEKTKNVGETPTRKDVKKSLNSVDGVKNVWFHRGRLHIAIDLKKKKNARRFIASGKCFKKDQRGNTLVIATKRLSDAAKMARADTRMRIQVKPMIAAHKENLRHLASVDSQDEWTEFVDLPKKSIQEKMPEKRKARKYLEYYDPEKLEQEDKKAGRTIVVNLYANSSESQREVMEEELLEEELDRKKSLSAPEGYVGHLYKEDRYQSPSWKLRQRKSGGLVAPKFHFPGEAELHKKQVR